MKIKTAESSDAIEYLKPHIEEGVYTAKLKEIKDLKEDDYGNKRVVFIYIIEKEKIDLPLVLTVPLAATPDNKFGRTLQAHGLDLKGQEIDVDPLVGTEVKAYVEDYEYEFEGEKKNASSIAKVKMLSDTEDEEETSETEEKVEEKKAEEPRLETPTA